MRGSLEREVKGATRQRGEDGEMETHLNNEKKTSNPLSSSGFPSVTF